MEQNDKKSVQTLPQQLTSSVLIVSCIELTFRLSCSDTFDILGNQGIFGKHASFELFQLSFSLFQPHDSDLPTVLVGNDAFLAIPILRSLVLQNPLPFPLSLDKREQSYPACDKRYSNPPCLLHRVQPINRRCPHRVEIPSMASSPQVQQDHVHHSSFHGHLLLQTSHSYALLLHSFYRKKIWIPSSNPVAFPLGMAIRPLNSSLTLADWHKD